MILENNGYVVETCFNGKEALDILEERSFDVVVSDLNMPVMDGFELLKNIKEREYDTEVLILTAFGTIETVSYTHLDVYKRQEYAKAEIYRRG